MAKKKRLGTADVEHLLYLHGLIVYGLLNKLAAI